MIGEFHHQKVDIVIPTDSPLYQRIAARANAEGVSVEAVVDMLISVGANQLMNERLDIMEGKKRKR